MKIIAWIKIHPIETLIIVLVVFAVLITIGNCLQEGGFYVRCGECGETFGPFSTQEEAVRYAEETSCPTDGMDLSRNYTILKQP